MFNCCQSSWVTNGLDSKVFHLRSVWSKRVKVCEDHWVVSARAITACVATVTSLWTHNDTEKKTSATKVTSRSLHRIMIIWLIWVYCYAICLRDTVLSVYDSNLLPLSSRLISTGKMKGKLHHLRPMYFLFCFRHFMYSLTTAFGPIWRILCIMYIILI